MDPSKPTEQHWQDLADLLGLPPDKAVASSKPAPPPIAPVPEESPRTLPESTAAAVPPMEAEQTRYEPIPEDASAAWEAEFEAADDDTAVVDDAEPADDTLSGDMEATVTRE